MKKIVLYCLTCLLFSACIKEDRDADCDARVRLIFTYEHSVSDFDSKVANEVYLQVFQNDVVVKTDMIPYEAIKGGKEYAIDDYTPGTYRFVAWAVPFNDDDVCEIPEVFIGDRYLDKSLDLSRNLTHETYYDPIGNIFLGEETFTIVADESSLHEVSLEPCICRVWFTVYNANLLMETRATAQDAWITLSGTRARMLFNGTPGSERSNIYHDLTYDSSSATLISGAMGVLPSVEGEYLKVIFYRQGDMIAEVNTNYVSVAGDEVRIIWTLGSELEVYVNGWRVREATITYF